ncbi:ATP-binding protein [bacterium]|nr:ATP-binding protein [bacterium]
MLWIKDVEETIRTNINKAIMKRLIKGGGRVLLRDDKDFMWLGTESGLLVYTEQAKLWKKFNTSDSDSTSISSNYIVDLCQDKDKNIWIATNEGLCIFNRDSANFTTFNEWHGLPFSAISNVFSDNDGYVWISTVKGFTRFKYNPLGVTKPDMLEGLKTFNKTDGKITRNSSFKANDGEVYIASDNGFTSFYPDRMTHNKIVPDVVVSDFKLFNKAVKIGGKDSPLKKAIAYCDEITLNPKQSIFSFAFSATNYNEPEHNQYAYMLKGLDKDWIYVGNKREVTYANIPSGKYTFRVKASNNQGLWNEEGTSIEIIILPPWWRIWWVQAIGLFMIIGSSIGFYLRRVTQLKLRQRILENKVKERTFALRNTNLELNEQKKNLEETYKQLKETQLKMVQSEKMASVGILTSGITHEINNPLNFIHGARVALQKIAQKNSKDQDKSVMPLLGMIETGVKRASDIVNSLNRFNRRSEHMDEVCQVSLIVDNCLNMLGNSLKNRIEVNKEFTTSPYKLVGNEGELHQVFLNVLQNAVQAIEDKGTITINTSVDKNYLVTSIIDDGYGISEENIQKITDPFFTTKAPGEGTGLGMSIVFSILKEHKGSIDYISKEGQGTTVQIKLLITMV